MWEHTKPKIGESFHVMQTKLYPSFTTSVITKIEEKENEILFETINSKYKLTWK